MSRLLIPAILLMTLSSCCSTVADYSLVELFAAPQAVNNMMPWLTGGVIVIFIVALIVRAFLEGLNQ